MIITPEGQIAATLVPLALALFAPFRWLDGKFDRIDGKFDSARQETKDDIQNLDNKIDRSDSKLSGEIQNLDDKIVRSDSKLSAEINEVRQASENSRKEIIGRQSKMETTLATHTERFNTLQAQIKCVED